MDAFVKKRKAPDGADKVRPTFVVCPGAGGGDCAALTQALATFGKTTTIANGKWAGNFPSQMGANVQLVVDAARRAAAARRARVVRKLEGARPGEAEREREPRSGRFHR